MLFLRKGLPAGVLEQDEQGHVYAGQLSPDAAGRGGQGAVRLDVPQWLICTAVALSVVVAAEIRKAVRRA